MPGAMESEPGSPLVLIAFNRPELLRQQLEIVRQHFRGKIYAIVDGPRADKVGEAEKVAEVVDLLESLKPEFAVEFNRAELNLGCYQRIKSGLDWVFARENTAVILEDDCMPSPQFFDFASEMLQRYAEDERVYSISGTNLFPELSPEGQLYFFSRYQNCWGWATWARAWQHFIDTPETWHSIRCSKAFRRYFPKMRSFLYWRRILDLTYSEQINSWAYRWMLSCWMQEGLSLYAHVNLITNVGDDDQATRTSNSNETRRPLMKLDHSLEGPREVTVNDKYDRNLEDRVYSKSLTYRLRWTLRKILKV